MECRVCFPSLLEHPPPGCVLQKKKDKKEKDTRSTHDRREENGPWESPGYRKRGNRKKDTRSTNEKESRMGHGSLGVHSLPVQEYPS